MAIVAPRRDHLAIWESTIDEGLGPCLDALRDDVKGVQVHRLNDRMRQHLGKRMGRAWRLPLLCTAWRDSWSAPMCMRILETICTEQLRVPYDLLGAAQARSFGFGWTRRFRRARSDANRAFFCSEFTAHVYQAMGWLGDDVVPSHENPKSLASLVASRGACGPPEEILL